MPVFLLESASEELYRVKKIARKIQRCLQNAVSPKRPINVCTCKVCPNLKFSICILMSLRLSRDFLSKFAKFSIHICMAETLKA